MTARVLFMQSQTYFGADSAIHALLMRHLDRNQFEVHVACNQGTDKNPSAALVELVKIPDLNIRPTSFLASMSYRSPWAVLDEVRSEGWSAIGSLSGLVRYARRNRIDVVHTTEKPRDAFFGLLLSRLVGARCCIGLHVKADTWMSPLVKWSMRHSDAIIGVSRFTMESARVQGYPEDRLYFVRNALNLADWSPQTIDGASVRKEFGVADDERLVTLVARVFPHKGHGRLLEALAPLRDLRFKVLFVGTDDLRATPSGRSYTADLRSLANGLGLHDRVIFAGDRRDIKQVMRASDIFAMPSYEEPFGMVFLEAMAMERPVVALASGGVPEIVEHGVTGLLSAPEDRDLLTSNLRTLMTNETLRHDMGHAGRAKVESAFNAHRMARDMERVYRTVLARPSMARQQAPATS